MRTQPRSYLRSSAFIRGLLIVGGLAVACGGCEMTRESESSTRKRQREALNDPFGYGPGKDLTSRDEEKVDPTDVTGGGTNNLNKAALKRDWDALLGNK